MHCRNLYSDAIYLVLANIARFHQCHSLLHREPLGLDTYIMKSIFYRLDVSIYHPT